MPPPLVDLGRARPAPPSLVDLGAPPPGRESPHRAGLPAHRDRGLAANSSRTPHRTYVGASGAGWAVGTQRLLREARALLGDGSSPPPRARGGRAKSTGAPPAESTVPYAESNGSYVESDVPYAEANVPYAEPNVPLAYSASRTLVLDDDDNVDAGEITNDDGAWPLWGESFGRDLAIGSEPVRRGDTGRAVLPGAPARSQLSSTREVDEIIARILGGGGHDRDPHSSGVHVAAAATTAASPRYDDDNDNRDLGYLEYQKHRSPSQNTARSQDAAARSQDAAARSQDAAARSQDAAHSNDHHADADRVSTPAPPANKQEEYDQLLHAMATLRRERSPSPAGKPTAFASASASAADFASSSGYAADSATTPNGRAPRPAEDQLAATHRLQQQHRQQTGR